MKTIFYFSFSFILFFFNNTSAEQITPNPLASGHSSSQVSELSSFANRSGTHTLYLWHWGNNNLLTYNRHTYNGWTFADLTFIIDDSVDNSPVITGDENRLLVIYAKKSKIYLVQSTDAGSNWSTLNTADFPSSDNKIYGMDASYKPIGDSTGVYVAYSTGHTGVDPEVYFKRYSLIQDNWVQADTITNETGMYGTSPSITFSSSNVYVSFTKNSISETGGQTKYRTRSFISSTWQSSVDISSLPYSNSGISSILADDSYVYSIVVGFENNGTNPIYFIKKNLSNGDTTRTKLTSEGYNYITPKLIKTADGTLNAFYVGSDSTNHQFFEWQQFNGSAWSRVGSKWYPASNVMNDLSCTSVGNDIYVYKNYYYNGDYWIDTATVWYNNGSPITPTNLSFVSQNQVKPTWSYNPEPDINNYEVWRKYWRSHFDNEDWTLKSSPTTNSWTDPDFQFDSDGDHYTVYYKIKAKDKSNQYSSFTSDLSTDAVMVFSKHGDIVEQGLPKYFNIGQNYPNPFNPSTTIDYGLSDK